uniref:Uncharacterized protein n=1 Tax=Anguilla anguilla TaxID=7936 RepID=A0A0E9U0I1_ANGAN
MCTLPFPKCTKFLNVAYFIFLTIYFIFYYSCFCN